MRAHLSFVIGLTLLVILVASTTAQAQRGAVFHRLQVRIYLPDNITVPEVIRVQLDSERTGLPVLTKNLIRETFTEFSNLTNGEYILTVTIDNEKQVESFTERFSLRSSFSLLRQINAFMSRKVENTSRNAPGTISASGTVDAREVNTQREIPKDARKAFERGQSKSEQGKSEDAIKAFLEALKHHPNYLDAINNLGVEYIKLSRFVEASEHLQHAVRLAPNSPLPHLNLGIILNEQKHYREALAELEQAVQLDFNNPLAHFQLGIACFQVSDFMRAQLEFEVTVGSAQKIPLSRLYLADVYKRLLRTADAIRQLESFLAENSDNPYTAVAREELTKLKSSK